MQRKLAPQVDADGGRNNALDVVSLRRQLDGMRGDVETLDLRAGSSVQLEHFRQYIRVVAMLNDWLHCQPEPTRDELMGEIYAELGRSGDDSGVAAAVADIRRWLERVTP